VYGWRRNPSEARFDVYQTTPSESANDFGQHGGGESNSMRDLDALLGSLVTSIAIA
jgi:hypothetical protein